MRRDTAMQSRSPLRVLKAADGLCLRLLCIPGAGSAASAYRNWVPFLPHHIELAVAQRPGREERIREIAHESVDRAVDEIVDLALPLLDRPLVLFCHSMGALLGFEVLRRLQSHMSISNVHFVAAASRAAHLPNRRPRIHGLDDRSFLRAMVDLGGTPASVLEEEELCAVLLPTLRADFKLLEDYAYTPGPLLSCPLIVLGGLWDDLVSHFELDAWRSLTTRSFSLRMLRGGHFFPQLDPAGTIATVLQAVRAAK